MSSFGEVVRARALRQGSREAFVFLADGERPSATLTYAELHREVTRLAARLAARAEPGDRALLVYPPGLEFVVAFLACLEAGLVAVPVHPPRPRAGLGALAVFAADAEPRLVLGTEALLDRLRRAEPLELPPPLAAASWLDTALGATGGGAPEPGGWSPPPVADDDLAFLQYTSGSTAAPKGVMVSHGNLAANEAAIEASFAMTEDSVVVSWLPPYHDMGLIGTVLQPLWSGGRAVLMAPLAFLQRPRRWLEAITRYRATTTGGPDFAYALTCDRVGESEREGLDLSSLTVAFTGAEPVRSATLERFHQAFAPSGFRRHAFYPCYGLAEATLFVSGGRVEAEPRVVEVARSGESLSGDTRDSPRRLVGCGSAWRGEVVRIADPLTHRPLPPGEEGEIRVAGPAVARGYWRQPDASRRVFGQPLAGEVGADGEAGPLGEGGAARPFLRTGDLGFLDADGELYVSGRLKDVLVVRGRNLYPQDLEATAEAAHAAARLAGAAAFAVDVEGQERVVVAVEVERRREAEAAELAAAVQRSLIAHHEVAPHAVLVLRAGHLPRTTSGKVRRQPTRRAWQAGTLETVFTTGDREPGGVQERSEEAGAVAGGESSLATPGDGSAAACVRRVVAEVTGADPAAASTGEGAPARILLDSLQALEVAHRVRAAGGPELPLSLLLAGPTFEELLDPEVVGSAAETDAERGAERGARGGAGDGAAARGPEPRRVAVQDGDPFPLSYGQRAILLAEGLAGGVAQNLLACAARLSRPAGPPLTGGEIARALSVLAERHPALRLRFPAPDGGAASAGADAADRRQVVVAGGSGLAASACLTRDAGALDAAALQSALADLATRPLDLAAGPPWRAVWWTGGAAGGAAGGADQEGADGTPLWVVHHATADLASLDLLLAELVTLLATPTTGAPHLAPDPAPISAPISAPASEVGLTPASFVDWQQRWLESPAGLAGLDFWRRELADLPPALDPPTDRPRRPLPSRAGGRVTRHLGADTVAALAAAARRAGTTPFAWAAAVWQAVLGRGCAAADLTLAVATAGRPGTGFRDVVGHFVNLLPLRSDLTRADAGTWSGLAAGAGRRLASALEHQHVPFPVLVETLAPPREPSRHPLAQVGLVFEASPRLAARTGGAGTAALILGLDAPAVPVVDAAGHRLELEPLALSAPAAEMDLLLSLVEDGGAGAACRAPAPWVAGLGYAAALFDEVTAHRWLDAWCRALKESLEAPGARWAEASWLAPEERRQLLAARTGEALDTPLVAVHRAFAEHASRRPETPAVVTLEAGTRRELSYGELARRVAALAGPLAAAGVGLEVRVGVLTEAAPARLVTLLAVLAAGGCVVALEPSDPPARHAELLAAAAATVTVVQSSRAEAQTEEERGPRLVVDAEGRLAAPLPQTEKPRAPVAPGSPQARDVPLEAAAYVVFTSGSSGRPKGVVVPHRAIAALARSDAQRRDLGPGARHLHAAALSFDIAMGELLVPLANGAAVVLAGDDARRSGRLLARRAEALGATHFITTPAVLDLIPAGQEPSALRQVCIGGEVCPPAVAARWVPILAARGGCLHNGYGPAETTVYSTLSSSPPGGVETIRSLGRPNPGMRLRLVDRHGGEAMPGAVGEIHLGGVAVARGYLGMPAATAAAFLPDPAAGGDGVPAGARLYRTGDLAVQRPGGDLVFGGRLDRQLKVRGVRVEPGEVEAALVALPPVAAAAVDRRGERLVAWVVPAAGEELGGAAAGPRDGAAPVVRDRSQDAPSDGAVDAVSDRALIRRLRLLLQDRLPASRIPDRIVVLAELPRTPHGKVDTGALPEPPDDAVDGAAPPPGAAESLEALVSALWAEALDLAAVPRDVSFFDLGGHSLALARIHDRLCHALGREIPLPDLFSHATVASLAAHLAAGGGADGGGSETQEGVDRRADVRRRAMGRLRRRRAATSPPSPGGSASSPGIPEPDPESADTNRHLMPAGADR